MFYYARFQGHTVKYPNFDQILLEMACDMYAMCFTGHYSNYY